MPIDRTDFDNLVEADLIELLATPVPEGLRVDYKRDLYGGSDADKREALKDISAFANAAGGHVIIGIDEEGGIPSAMPGVVAPDPDAVVLRLDQLARTGIEPRMQGLRIRAIPLASGTYCFVVRIPKSWNVPHRVSANGSNRYWIRNSGGSHEASMDELRTLFTQSSDASQRVQEFRDLRLARITSGRGSRPLYGEGRLILHIIPLASILSSQSIDLERAHELGTTFPPIGNTGRSPRFNLDGFINERGGDANHGYTQIFRNGILEATKAAIRRERGGRHFIPGIGLEEQVFKVLPQYLNGLRDLGVPAPVIVLLTLEGVEGAAYAVASGLFAEPEPPFEEDIVYLPECLVNEYGNADSYQRALRPAIDALWNAAGYSSAQTYDGDGRWIGNERR